MAGACSLKNTSMMIAIPSDTPAGTLQKSR